MTAKAPMSPQRQEMLQHLAQRLSVPCKNLELLDKATTHKSYAAEHDVEDFERLEFFGDAVLKFVVAEYLFGEFPAEDEGELTEICAVLISAKTLESVGLSFELESYIRVGRGVPMKPSIIARSMEALLGAIYLDSKFKNIRPFIIEHICSRASAIAGDAVKENYKAQLQQYTQARAQGTPVYSVLKVDGPPHDPVFQVAVLINERVIGQGSGRSKKIAEQDAARDAMARLMPKLT
jgi:ribonuclease III